MQISITVPEEILRAAEAREVPTIEFVEMLIQRGMESLSPRPALNDAIERIRALRAPGPPVK
jgi:hypothetical protein